MMTLEIASGAINYATELSAKHSQLLRHETRQKHIGREEIIFCSVTTDKAQEASH